MSLAIIAIGSFVFGQTHDFEYEDGRNAHMVPTKEQKDKLQCSAAALFREVTQSQQTYTVTCSDYNYTYTYIKTFGSPGGGGGGTHLPTPAPDENSPVH